MQAEKWQSLQQSADRARKAADHEKAIELYTQALAKKKVPWAAFVDMTITCAYSQRMLGQCTDADTLLSKLFEKANEQGDDVTVVKAFAEMISVMRQSRSFKNVQLLGQDVLTKAKRIGKRNLIAKTLLSIANLYHGLAEFQTAQDYLAEAEIWIDPEDKQNMLLALYMKVFLSDTYEKPIQDIASLINQALQIARSIDDHDWEGIFLNLGANNNTDLTISQSLYEQALTAFEAAGDQDWHASVLFNCTLEDIAFGFYKRAIETLKALLNMKRRIPNLSLSSPGACRLIYG
jgi:tetratricopeptide (TPR) repeat protein